MNDSTEGQPVSAEVLALRQRVAALEAAEAERQHAEAERRKSEEKLRALSEAALDAVILMDPQGIITHWNPAAARMFGHAAGDALGRPMHDLIAPHRFREAAELGLRHFMHAGDGPVMGRVVEFTALRADGQEFPVELSVSPVQLDDRWWALAIVRDISRRKRSQLLQQGQRDLGDALSKTDVLQEAMACSLEITLQVTGMDCGGFYLLDAAGSLRLEVVRGVPAEFHAEIEHYPAHSPQAEQVRNGKPVYMNLTQEPPRIGNVGTRLGIHAFAVLPICHQQRPVGSLVLGSRTVDQLSHSTRNVLEAMAAQIAAALGRIFVRDAERTHLRAMRKLLDQYEADRKLTAYDIHDSITQPVTSAIMELDAIGSRLPMVHGRKEDGKAEPPLAGCLQRSRDLLVHCLAETRRMMSGLRPTVLDDFGVVAAVEQLIEGMRAPHGPLLEWSPAASVPRLPPEVETAIYRIIQEGLINALQHSGSARIRVRLENCGEHVRVEIQDWGRGFQPVDVPAERFGLEGIRERARILGGEARILSAPGAGTTLLVDLPVLLGSSGD